MAATSHLTLPTSKYHGHGSQEDSYKLPHHGTYDSGIGSLTSHPYQYQANSYGASFTESQQQSVYSNDYHQLSHPNIEYSNKKPQNTLIHNQQKKKQPLNNDSNSNTSKSNDGKQGIQNNKNTNVNYGTTKTVQLPNKKNIDNQPKESKNNKQNPHAETVQHHPPVPVNNQHQQSTLIRSERQISNHPPKQQQQQQQNKFQPPLQSHLSRSDNQISKAREVPHPPATRHHSFSNDKNNHVLEPGHKPTYASVELKPTKSSTMRAAAIKKKEETLEEKRKGKYFPPKLKSQQTSPQTDAEQSDAEKTQKKKKTKHSLSKTEKSHSDGEHTDISKTPRNKKKSHSESSYRKSRRDGYHTDNNASSGDDEHNHKRQRSKSHKKTTVSDTHLDKPPQLPPIRRSRLPPHYDSHKDYPFPPGHPLRGRYPYYDDYPHYGHYPHRHLHQDAPHIPPYLAPYHDPYDPFFDYQKRKAQPKRTKSKTDGHNDREDHNGYETERDDDTKSQVSRKSRQKTHNTGRKSRHDIDEHRHPYWQQGYYPPQYYDEHDMLEVWRQERNDYFKKKYKPTIHDVLYAQQWMKSDSYLENQRRRALRDIQGYYFPYKKYTLQDYKDIQKLNNQNPFAEVPEATIDRKERARKRQEYGTLVERQIVDNPGTRQIPPREMPPRKPWHLSGSETRDLNAASKRERAIEYAKEQVKYRPVNPNKSHSQTEHYENSYSSEINDGDDDNQHANKTYQLYDNYD